MANFSQLIPWSIPSADGPGGQPGIRNKTPFRTIVQSRLSPGLSLGLSLRLSLELSLGLPQKQGLCQVVNGRDFGTLSDF